MNLIGKNLHKLFPYSFFPSQLDICFSEKCNQDCDYCFVNKASSGALNFAQVKKGVNLFLKLPGKHKTITFTTSEPFLNFSLYKKSVDYIFKNKKGGGKIQLVTTTNGLLLKGQVASFVRDKINDRDFRLNLSLDGGKASHDQHRKIKNAPDISAFEISWGNFCCLPRDRVRIIFTITPDQVNLLEENVNFIFDNGFRNIDLFPRMFYLWSEPALRQLKENLFSLIEKLNHQKKIRYNLRLLNRLWGASHYAKLLLASDGNFYLCEWILPLTLKKRKRFIIGDVNQGIDLIQRQLLFNRLFSEIAVATGGKCLDCPLSIFCAFPLPLWLWATCYRYNFRKYFNNFCAITKIFIEAARLIDQRFKNEIDLKRLSFSDTT